MYKYLHQVSNMCMKNSQSAIDLATELLLVSTRTLAIMEYAHKRALELKDALRPDHSSAYRQRVLDDCRTAEVRKLIVLEQVKEAKLELERAKSRSEDAKTSVLKAIAKAKAKHAEKKALESDLWVFVEKDASKKLDSNEAYCNSLRERYWKLCVKHDRLMKSKATWDCILSVRLKLAYIKEQIRSTQRWIEYVKTISK